MFRRQRSEKLRSCIEEYYGQHLRLPIDLIKQEHHKTYSVLVFDGPTSAPFELRHALKDEFDVTFSFFVDSITHTDCLRVRLEHVSIYTYSKVQYLLLFYSVLITCVLVGTVLHRLTHNEHPIFPVEWLASWWNLTKSPVARPEFAAAATEATLTS